MSVHAEPIDYFVDIDAFVTAFDHLARSAKQTSKIQTERAFRSLVQSMHRVDRILNPGRWNLATVASGSWKLDPETGHGVSLFLTTYERLRYQFFVLAVTAGWQNQVGTNWETVTLIPREKLGEIAEVAAAIEELLDDLKAVIGSDGFGYWTIQPTGNEAPPEQNGNVFGDNDNGNGDDDPWTLLKRDANTHGVFTPKESALLKAILDNKDRKITYSYLLTPMGWNYKLERFADKEAFNNNLGTVCNKLNKKLASRSTPMKINRENNLVCIDILPYSDG